MCSPHTAPKPYDKFGSCSLNLQAWQSRPPTASQPLLPSLPAYIAPTRQVPDCVTAYGQMPFVSPAGSLPLDPRRWARKEALIGQKRFSGRWYVASPPPPSFIHRPAPLRRGLLSGGNPRRERARRDGSLEMCSGTTFVSVPTATLFDALEEVGKKVQDGGGKCRPFSRGREIVYDFTEEGQLATVRVYTTATEGEARLRECGEDSVKMILMGLGAFRKGGIWIDGGLTLTQKLHRTAGRNLPEGERADKFVGRVVKKVWQLLEEARKHPTCCCCDSLMVVRRGHPDFYGCGSYPKCQYSRQLVEPWDK